MKNFFKKYIWVIAGVLIAAAILLFAFMSGGNVEEAKKAASSSSSNDSVSVSQTSGVYHTSAATDANEPTAVKTTAETTQALTSTNPTTNKSTEPATTSVPKTTSAEKPANPKKTTEPTTNPTSTTKPQQTKPQQAKPTEAVKCCTFSISCATLLNNMGKLDEDDRELVPSDGWILSPVTVNYEDGDSVFDVLKRECKAHGIHMEFSTAPIYNTAYIEGIGNLFEFSAGSNSGWMYRVNGKFPNYGCSLYDVKSGDVIEWLYTCDLGHDIGGSNYSK